MIGAVGIIRKNPKWMKEVWISVKQALMLLLIRFLLLGCCFIQHCLSSIHYLNKLAMQVHSQLILEHHLRIIVRTIYRSLRYLLLQVIITLLLRLVIHRFLTPKVVALSNRITFKLTMQVISAHAGGMMTIMRQTREWSKIFKKVILLTNVWNKCRKVLIGR